MDIILCCPSFLTLLYAFKLFLKWSILIIYFSLKSIFCLFWDLIYIQPIFRCRVHRIIKCTELQPQTELSCRRFPSPTLLLMSIYTTFPLLSLTTGKHWWWTFFISNSYYYSLLVNRNISDFCIDLVPCNFNGFAD